MTKKGISNVKALARCRRYLNLLDVQPAASSFDKPGVIENAGYLPDVLDSRQRHLGMGAIVGSDANRADARQTLQWPLLESDVVHVEQLDAVVDVPQDACLVDESL